MHLLLLSSLVFLSSTVPGQAVNYPACTQADLTLNRFLKSHETDCSVFYKCVSPSQAAIMRCPSQLLFDDLSKNCKWPKETNCLNKNCYPGENTRWPHHCCDQYYQCGSKGFEIVTCDPGTVFNANTGQCVIDYPCQTNITCNTRYTTPAAPVACPNRPVPDDPCKFKVVDANGVVLATQSCGAGTSFNATACNCANLDPRCSQSVVVTNKLPDPECRTTMILDFTTKRPLSYTMKTADGQRALTSYFIYSMGYTPSGTEGIFNSTAQEKARLYFSPFVDNMLLGPFGIKISFKVDSPVEGYSFAVITNNWADMIEGSRGTLDVIARYTRRSWSIVFSAIGYDDVFGTETQARMEVTVPDVNDYVTVSLMFSKEQRSILGLAYSRRLSSNQWTSAFVGDRIRNGEYGLGVGYGLTGRINKVEFTQACTNERLLRQKLE